MPAAAHGRLVAIAQQGCCGHLRCCRRASSLPHCPEARRFRELRLRCLGDHWCDIAHNSDVAPRALSQVARSASCRVRAEVKAAQRFPRARQYYEQKAFGALPAEGSTAGQTHQCSSDSALARSDISNRRSGQSDRSAFFGAAAQEAVPCDRHTSNRAGAVRVCAPSSANPSLAIASKAVVRWANVELQARLSDLAEWKTPARSSRPAGNSLVLAS